MQIVPIKLVSQSYTQDEIGQFVPTESETEVLPRMINSVSRDEWFNAGKSGFKAEYQITMFRFDYNGEKECELDGKRYGIYRTYEVDNDNIELYLSEKTGVFDDNSGQTGS